MERLELHGVWASPFCLMVEIALKLKGIPYTYEQENLEDKSESLLRYNPIHKKVPVLVHDGKPIVESFVVLEYIEEMWKSPPLFPSDPYEKARVRFWIAFLYDKFIPPCRSIVVTQGIEQEEAILESKEHLITFEDGIANEFPTETRFFNGNKPGMLDIVIGSTSCWLRVLSELTGVNLIDEKTTPILCQRLEAFEEVLAVKETIPKNDKLTAYAKSVRNKALGSKGN